MPAEYTQGDQFRGARIHLCDLSGLEIRDCDVTGLKIVDCYGGNVSLGGFEREAEHHRYAVRDPTVLQAGARTE
ncbi:hypothetical protein [Cryptosporangium sp. NPDC051539]|uniref:hypothetical protein n=1 Tax=Cryptosporangium sp. NPDC051539 TaxID=3363962 RepID=UPI0037BB6C02